MSARNTAKVPQRPLVRLIGTLQELLGFRHAGAVRPGDRVFYFLVRLAAVAVIVISALLVVELFRGSWEAIRKFGLGFVWGTTWDPVTEEFSTLPTIVGTIVKSLIAVLLAVPISIGTAIFIVFYCPKVLRTPISYLVESLAAIPSIVFGLWGLFVLVPVMRTAQIWIKAHTGGIPPFQGPAVYGVGVLAGGVILAIMITPIIASISRDIIRTVPRSQTEAALALGATKWESIWKVVLPYARIGLFGAVILGLGRALGETMAVTLVGGNAFAVITSVFDPVHSMASQIASEFSEATYKLYVSALIYVGLVLFVITLVVNGAAQWLIYRISKGRVAVVD